METYLTYIGWLLAIGALFFIGAALALVSTEKPASHWIAENKRLDEECPPWR
jgi:hypothetical protein